MVVYLHKIAYLNFVGLGAAVACVTQKLPALNKNGKSLSVWTPFIFKGPVDRGVRSTEKITFCMGNVTTFYISLKYTWVKEKNIYIYITVQKFSHYDLK